MPNFDLTTLRRCNAKTRKGTNCRRYGSIHNGRCKLHGGRSTGPKTDMGKLMTSGNRGSNIMRLARSYFVTDKDFYDAEKLYEKLMSFLADDIDWESLDIFVARNILKLERLKYVASAAIGHSDATLNIQQVLDNYYIHNGSHHMRFHILMLQPQMGPFKRDCVSRGYLEYSITKKRFW